MAYRLALVVVHLCIFAVQAFGYQAFIVPLYGYEGYVFTPDAANGYVAVLALIALSLITPITYRNPSTLFFQITLIVAVSPMLVLFYAEGKDWAYPAQFICAYVVSVMLLRVVNVKTFAFSFLSEARLMHAMLVLAYGYVATIILLGGATYFNLDFSKVYDFRDEAASNLPPMFGYVSPVIAKVVLPVGLVISVIYKKYLLACFYLACAIVIFGLTSHKGTVFDPLLVLFVYLASSSRRLTLQFNIGILALLILSNVGFQIAMSTDLDGVWGWIGSLMLGRAFILPAEINYMYYDFFSRNDWVLFSNSKIGLGLSEFTYPLDVPHLIGREYFDSDLTGANAGWIGSGYAQAGFAGLLLYGAATAVIYRYIDACARISGRPRLVLASTVVPVSSLITSSDLPTVLLTHGLLLSLFVVSCLRPPRVEPPRLPKGGHRAGRDFRFHRNEVAPPTGAARPI